MVIVIVISCSVNNHYVIKCKEPKLCYIEVLLHNLTRLCTQSHVYDMWPMQLQ